MMTMPLETAGRTAASPQARAEQPPQGHGQRWLFELEQALFAQNGQGAARRGAAAEVERHAAVPVTVGSAAVGATGGTTATAPAIAGQAQPLAAEDNGDLPAKPLPSSLMVPAAYASYALPGAAASAVPQASLAAMAAVPLTGTQGGADASLVAGMRELAEMPIRSIAPPLLAASGTLATIPGVLPGAEQEAVETAAETRPAPQAPDEIAPRQLHLYRDGDGVHAWVRDAALSETQGRMVAQAMALELRVAGGRLKAMTVNGRMLQMALPAYAQADSFVDEQTWQAGTGAAGPSFMTKDAI